MNTDLKLFILKQISLEYIFRIIKLMYTNGILFHKSKKVRRS